MMTLDRAVLGRQRDLAGARRRRPAGRLPARLCGDHAGALSAGDRHAAGAGVSRRRLRIPHARAPARRSGTSAFAGGSTLAGFCQGVILGGLIQGIKVENGAFAGGSFDWATPFALLCGLGVLAGYALLGATWLVMKTEGAIAERARAPGEGAARRSCSPSWRRSACGRRSPSRASPSAGSRCRTSAILWPVPVVTALVAFAAWRWLERGREARAVLRLDRAVPARLSRPGDLDLSLSGAADADDLADRRGAGEPDLHAGRHAGAAADHPRLHGAGLLAVPRQGRAEARGYH